jgi:hypothetical protein
MISCHEGTSSQTIFSAETKLLTLCKDTEYDVRSERDMGFMAIRDIMYAFSMRTQHRDTRLGYRNLSRWLHDARAYAISRYRSSQN